jgi:hypothetical protein
MASKRIYKTEEGTLRYPWLNKPDTKFQDEGVYKTSFILSPDKAQDLIKMVRECAKDELGKKADKARLPFATDSDTGDIIFTMKSYYQPKFVDSQGNPITSKMPPIYGGSKVRLKGDMYTYDKGANVGVGMALLAVQIIDLADKPSSGGQSEGFEPVSGGWVHDGSDSGSEEADVSYGGTKANDYDF